MLDQYLLLTNLQISSLQYRTFLNNVTLESILNLYK
jgi:hypothetical protein